VAQLVHTLETAFVIKNSNYVDCSPMNCFLCRKMRLKSVWLNVGLQSD